MKRTVYLDADDESGTYRLRKMEYKDHIVLRNYDNRNFRHQSYRHTLIVELDIPAENVTTMPNTRSNSLYVYANDYQDKPSDADDDAACTTGAGGARTDSAPTSG